MASAPASPGPEPNDESLAKMSFGDHLDELRRRLMLSVIAVAVCVVGMLPFKDAVSAVYMQPYREMWQTGFAAYLELKDAELAERGGLQALRARAAGDAGAPADPTAALHVQRHEFLETHREAIVAGEFDFEEFGESIQSIGGFKVPYNLVAIGGIEEFWTFMAASVLFSLILAAPFVLYQVWAFVAAGLYKHERRVVLRYLPGAVLLLIAGVAFGYWIVVPTGLYYLVELMNFGMVQPMFSVSNYFRLLFTLTAALGVVFQLPLLMLALNRAHVVSHAAFRKHWRVIVLCMFVTSAMLTPPDPFTQVMMGVPMVGLYLVGLWLTGRAERREARRAGSAA